MGASESIPATPASKPLLNKHLAHVSDPRSPTAGILRTPIEVESSPQGSPLVDPQEEGLVDDESELGPSFPNTRHLANTYESCGGRSVSGLSLPDAISNLVKQLSEAFAVTAAEEGPLPEDPSHQGQKHKGTSVVEEALRQEVSSGEASQREAEGKELLSENTPGAAAPRAVANPADALRPAGSKPVRRRPSGKMPAISAGSGRSPLSVLQDDNSPSPLVSQSKRHPSMADSQGEPKEGVWASGRSLKAGSCGRGYSLNKENRHCHLVEN